MFNCEKCKNNIETVVPAILCTHCQKAVKTMIDDHPTYFAHREANKYIEVICVDCYKKGIKFKK